VVEFAVRSFGRGPALPAVRLVEDVAVLAAFELRVVGFVLFQAIEVFQEQQPRSLLGVVQLGGAAGFFLQHVVDVFEGLFEHGGQGAV
jgi:hypothetical protein